MGIPVEVPGLDTIIPELGDGQLVVVDGTTDPAKSFFVRGLCLSAIRKHWPVTFVTSRDREELLGQLSTEGGNGLIGGDLVEIRERDVVHSLDEFATKGGLLAVDSFSFLTLDLGPSRLAELLRSLRAVGRDKLTTVVLTTDRGMSDGRSEAIATHLADGMFQFHAKEGPEGLLRYLRIPKWADGRFVDRNIYYDFDGKRIAIDLRRRVL